MDTNEPMSVRVPCPACSEWLDVDVLPRRGLVVDTDLVVTDAVLTIEVVEDSMRALVDEHACFVPTVEDQQQIEDAANGLTPPWSGAERKPRF